MKHIIALAILSLSSFSFSSEANECSTGGCGTDNHNLSGAQAQSTYNDLTQSPTMALAGSNSNTIINANSVSSSSVALSADGGMNFTGSCATDTWAVGVTVGGNQMQTRPSRFQSDSINGAITLNYVAPTGEAQDLCLQGKRVQVRAQELAYSKLLITTCLTFINSGIDVHGLAAIDDQYAMCPTILKEAINGYHGKIGRQAVANYKKAIEQQTGIPADANQGAVVKAAFTK